MKLLSTFLVVALLIFGCNSENRKPIVDFGIVGNDLLDNRLDTIMENKLEEHEMINMAWIEFDVSHQSWDTWILGDTINHEQRYNRTDSSLIYDSLISYVESFK